jgi:hypothetical protein
MFLLYLTLPPCPHLHSYYHYSYYSYSFLSILRLSCLFLSLISCVLFISFFLSFSSVHSCSFCSSFIYHISSSLIPTILNEGTTFRNKLWVFSLFYTALHVSAYKQAIFRCFLTNHRKVKLLSYFSVDPPSHDITIVVTYTSKYSINTLCVQVLFYPIQISLIFNF